MEFVLVAVAVVLAVAALVAYVVVGATRQDRRRRAPGRRRSEPEGPRSERLAGRDG